MRASVRDVPAVRRAVAKARRRSTWSSRSRGSNRSRGQRPTERPAGLPADYVVAKFYFSKAFPETAENQAFIADMLRTVSRQVPVALLSTSVRLDEHSDYQSASRLGRVRRRCARRRRRRISSGRPQLIAGARGFVGTYGGFSYLAPFYGVPSLSFFSRRGFEAHHLDLARSRVRPVAAWRLSSRSIDATRRLVDSAVNWVGAPSEDAVADVTLLARLRRAVAGGVTTRMLSSG